MIIKCSEEESVLTHGGIRAGDGIEAGMRLTSDQKYPHSYVRNQI